MLASKKRREGERRRESEGKRERERERERAPPALSFLIYSRKQNTFS